MVDGTEEFTTQAAPTNVPVSIGKYVLDSENQTWKAQNANDHSRDIFKGHTHEGSNDWAYNHNRLTYPGESKLKVRFQIPASMFRKLSPDCTFLMRTSYFAPWNMDPCTISVTINDEKVLKSV